MKKILIVIFICINFSLLFASEYSISYVNSSRKDHLLVVKLDNKNYFNIYDWERIFDGKVNVDANLQRIILTIFEKKCIFFFYSKWVKFGNRNYNLHDKIKIENKNFYIPEYFIQLCNEKFFSEFITLENKNIVLNLSTMKKFLIRKIVLDPGHGGKDPGAVGRTLKLKEKDVVLKIAKEVEKLLKKNLNVEVLLTRETDKFVSLRGRTDFANNHQADLFISIHCNAAYSRKANGSEVYYLSPAKSDEARAVEALENDVIKFEEPDAIKRYTDLDFILYDMKQSEHLRESIELANMTQKLLVNNLGTKNKGVKFANFYVLRGAFMPAILLEIAFLSNKFEEKKLNSKSFQKKAAKAVYESIKQFKEKYDKMN